MRKRLLLMLMAACSLMVKAQDIQSKILPDSLVNRAAYMYAYDEAAMLASDSLKAAATAGPGILSADYFCLKYRHDWIVVFGAVVQDTFRTSLSYRVDSSRNVSLYTGPKGNLYDSYSRAYAHSLKLFAPVTDSLNIIFSIFMDSRIDSTIEVIIVPAFQPSGQALYGAEFRYTFSKDGQKMLNEFRYYSGLKGLWIGQPRNIYLNYRDLENPSVGAVFFAWYYKDFFKRVSVACRTATWHLQKNSAGEYIWSKEAAKTSPVKEE